MPFLNVGHDGLEFFFHGAKDLVLQVFSNHGPMGGNNNGLKAIDLLKLKGLCIGCARHAAKLGVHAKVILKGNGGKGLVFRLNAHPLFGLNGLMKAIGPTPSGHEAACEFINNDNLAVLDHVLLIAKVQGMGPKGSHEVMQQAYVGRVVKA